jgi:hypothetical protein
MVKLLPCSEIIEDAVGTASHGDGDFGRSGCSGEMQWGRFLAHFIVPYGKEDRSGRYLASPGKAMETVTRALAQVGSMLQKGNKHILSMILREEALFAGF